MLGWKLKKRESLKCVELRCCRIRCYRRGINVGVNFICNYVDVNILIILYGIIIFWGIGVINYF